jgi:hypothetical protein
MKRVKYEYTSQIAQKCALMSSNVKSDPKNGTLTPNLGGVGPQYVTADPRSTAACPPVPACPAGAPPGSSVPRASVAGRGTPPQAPALSPGGRGPLSRCPRGHGADSKKLSKKKCCYLRDD